MPSVSIPIRFSQEEKYVLQQLAADSNMPLSTFVKSKLATIITPKLKHINKSTVLIQKIKSMKLDPKELDEIEAVGLDFRKNFKLIKGK